MLKTIEKNNDVPKSQVSGCCIEFNTVLATTLTEYPVYQLNIMEKVLFNAVDSFWLFNIF